MKECKNTVCFGPGFPKASVIRSVSLGDRMQRALNEMLANEEKYNIKNNDNDNKSNI